MNIIDYMEFYPVEQNNLNECVALFTSVFNNPPWHENWDVEVATRRLEDCYHTPGFYGLIVRTEGEVIGFAIGFIEHWNKGKHFYLKEMCVASAQQRRGVGTALINVLEANLKKQGVEKLYLHTARDTSAQAFYEKHGFSVSSKMIIMAKWLEMSNHAK